MTQEMKQGNRGRPHRKSDPFVIRGTVPDGHPLYEQLRVLGSARAAMFLLELATNRLDGFVTGQHSERIPELTQIAGETENNLLSLKSHPYIGKSTQVNASTIIPFDDMSDLLNFSGSGS